MRPKQSQKFRVTTDSKHNMPVAPNLLNRQFVVLRTDTVRASDITYIHTREGWLYLAVVMDLYSSRVVGWAMNNRIKRRLVMDALKMAKKSRTPINGMLFHSDRGSQYASRDFQNLLEKSGCRSSMSSKGDCWDNGVPRTPQGGVPQEMRVWPLGAGLQGRVPNCVELLG